MSTSNSSSTCPDWFINSGLILKGNNSTNVGSCPDAITIPILSGIFFSFYIILVSFSVFGFIWKRDSSHIQMRTIGGMLFTIFSSVSIVSVFSIRYIIGRDIFPCLLVSSVFYLIAASCSMPNILRSLRIYLQWKVNLLKANSFKEYEKRAEKIVENVESLWLTNERSPSSPSSMSVHSPTEITSINQERVDQPSNLNDFNQTIILNRKEKYFMDAYRILHSNKVIITVFIIVFGIHLMIWFLFAIIEDSLFETTRFLLSEGSMLSLQGCILDQLTSYVVVVEYCFYFIFQSICFVLLLMTDKDTYFIKMETILTIVWQLICVILYVITIQEYYDLFDHLIPSGLIMVTYCIGEIILTITLPVIYSVVRDSSKNQLFDSELEWALNKSEICDMLLEYARRSYCPEGVLVYKDISKYKLASTFKKRKRLAMQVVNSYLTPGGVFELNLPNMKCLREEILMKINSAIVEEELSDDLFQSVQVQTLIVLKDVLERMRRNNEKMRKMLSEWRRIQVEEIMITSQPGALRKSVVAPETVN